MSSVLTEAAIEIVPASKVVTSSAVIADLDLEKCGIDDTEFSADFEVTVDGKGGEGGEVEVTAVAGYFDTFFELEQEKVRFLINFQPFYSFLFNKFVK